MARSGEVHVKLVVDTSEFAAAIAKAQDQHSRILANCDSLAWEYDLAVALGYEPESWSGMWKLTQHPFLIIGPYVLITEVVSGPTTGVARIRHGRIRTRRLIRKLPRT